MRGCLRRRLPILFALAALSCGGAEREVDRQRQWPAWRGPLANGVAPHASPPLEWDESRSIRWKVALPGPGHATPAIWGDRVYVVAAVRTDRRPAPIPHTAVPASTDLSHSARATNVHEFRLLAFERETGAEVWQTVVREEVPHESGHITASRASASPITDGEHIWAFFGSYGLYCLDRDGHVVWETDFGDMQTLNEFGEGASPALHGDTLVVNWDHEGDSFLVALDKRTGEERWRTERDGPTSWSTPLIVEDDGRAVVIVSGSHRVRAYELTTGREIWHSGGVGDSCIPSPVADAERVFVMSGHRDKAGLAIRYRSARGDLTETDAISWRIDRGLSYVPSPLLYDGTLYFIERFTAKLSCYDLASGTPHYTRQRLEGLGGVFASPVGAGGRIYILARSGKTVVLRHGERFEQLASNKLDDVFDASPAIAGNEIYLRGHEFLYRISE